MKKRAINYLRTYVTFFLLIAFVIDCCMMLFLYLMRRSVDVTFTEKNIRTAAVLTFGNVLLLSLVCTAIDAVRRRYMVEHPVRRIIQGAERIMEGTSRLASSPFTASTARAVLT